MGRDVEADLVANDKTSPGLRSAEERFRRASKKINDEGDKLNSNFAKSVVGVAEKISPKLAAGLTRAFASAGEAGGPLLVSGAVAAAPLLAATVSAALIAGAAVGAVGIGVAIVSQDARVQAAGKQLGESLMSGLQDDAVVFVQPVLDGIDLIEQRFADTRGTIRSIFDNGAEFVQPLVDGATRGLQGILRGVDELVANAGPVVDVLADGLDQLGNDFGDFMGDIAGQSDGAAAALQTVFDTLSTILAITGPLIAGLTAVFGFLDRIGFVDNIMNSLIAGPFGAFLTDTKQKTDDVATSTGGMATQFQKAADATKMQQAAAAALGPTMQEVKADIDAVTQANRALYGSDTDVAAAIADMNEKLKENGRTHSLATEKGRENRRGLDQFVGTLQAAYNNFVKVNGAGAASIARGDELRASFIKAAEGAGYSAREAKRMATNILGIPARKVSDLYANTHDAQARIAALKSNINSVPRRVDVTFQATYRGFNNQTSPSAGNAIRSRNFDASSTWSAGGGGVSRTGGPVSVTSTIDNRIYLDGRPFRQYTDKTVADDRRAADYRDRVGAR